MVKHLNHLVPWLKRQEIPVSVFFSLILVNKTFVSHYALRVMCMYILIHLNLRFSSLDIAKPWLHSVPSSVSKNSTGGIVVGGQDCSNTQPQFTSQSVTEQIFTHYHSPS